MVQFLALLEHLWKTRLESNMSSRKTVWTKAISEGLFFTAIGLGAAVLALPAWASSAQPAGKPPNFIVVMADDLGAKELACYGHEEHKTPHLDALASTGVMFRTCYATPICHPTRFLIMTGQYGCHNGIYNFAGRRGGPKPTDAAENIANHITFAKVLKTKGYATALAGKWQLTGKIPTLIYETGFDEYCMWAYRHNLPEGVEHTGGWEGKGQKKTSRYWHPSIVKNTKYLQTKPDDYGPDIFTDFVIDFARRHKEGPFLVYFPMALTHSPRYSTPDTTTSSKDKFRNLKSNFKSNVEYMDKLLGRIVKALDEVGIRDNTILFFTADNGTGGDGKGRPTELGARVPMIVNCPGTVKAKGAVEELIDLSDILPTLADFAGADLPKDRPIDGRSFAPFLRGEEWSPREWIHSYIADRRILRTKRWLLEDNSPLHYGRLYDCGERRDGIGYKEVTKSESPEVLAVKKRFDEILKDLPAPVLASEGKATDLKAKKKQRAGGKRSRKKRE